MRRALLPSLCLLCLLCLLSLSLLAPALAQRVSGTAPPWTPGTHFQQTDPAGALADLSAGRSDALLSSLPLPPTPAGSGRILYLPVGVYAVAVAYNLPGVNLRLDLNTLCSLLGGDLRLWNDPQLARLNPGTDLPALPVLVSSLSVPNAASLTVARSCVGNGQWPAARLKASWEAGAVYLRPSLDFVQHDLGRPGALALLAPGTLPPGSQLARLRTIGGRFVLPVPQLGLAGAAASSAVSGSPPPERLPAAPALPLAPASQPGAYPLRGLVWAGVFQDQAYRGRSVQDARDLLGWLERLRAGSSPDFAAIPPAFRAPIRLYYNGTPLKGP